MDDLQSRYCIESLPNSDIASDIIASDIAVESAEQQTARRWVVMRQSYVWRPPTDVFETANRLVVMVEIAGMRDGEFNVALQDRRLVITGSRPRSAHERVAFHQMEVRYGDFRTEVNLPWSVGRDNVSAVYRDGFLYVELPRARNQQIRIVEVEQEADV